MQALIIGHCYIKNNMGYIKPLITLQFWFDMTPPPLLPVFYWAFFIFFGLLIFAGITSGRIYKKKKEDFILRFSAKYLKNWFYSAGAAGLLLMMFSYERVALFSSRFWFILWFVGFGVWLFFIIRKLKVLPKKEEELNKKKEFVKYLPKKRKA